MKPHVCTLAYRKRIALSFLLGFTGLVVLGGAPAAAATAADTQDTAVAIPDMRGTFRGFFNSAAGSVPCALEVTEQSQDLLAGKLTIQITVLSVVGQISQGPANVRLRVGLNPGQDPIPLDLGLTDLGNGGGILRGILRIHDDDGSSLEGPVVMLRPFNCRAEATPPDVKGKWLGEFASALSSGAGDVVLDFTRPEDAFQIDVNGPQDANLIGVITGGQFGQGSGIGSISIDGRVILIAQSHFGLLIIAGDLTGSDSAREINAIYTITISAEGGGEWDVDVGHVECRRCL